MGENDPTGDEKFFSLSRQPKCIPIIATQSIERGKGCIRDRLYARFDADDVPLRGLPIKYSAIQAKFKCIGRAIRPDASEIAVNPRARSATLRVGEKV